MRSVEEIDGMSNLQSELKRIEGEALTHDKKVTYTNRIRNVIRIRLHVLQGILECKRTTDYELRILLPLLRHQFDDQNFQ